MHDEEQLLKRLYQQDETALGEVFDMYYEPIYRYVRQHVGHAETAEDITAEVFRRFLESMESGRGPAAYIRAWLYRVAHNLIVDDARRQTHRGHLELDERLIAGEGDVAEQAERQLLIGHTRIALEDLTESQRSVIILKYIQGLDNNEIAKILDLHVGAVRALSHRGIKALRRSLTNRGVI